MEPNIGPYGFYIEAFFEISTCRSTGMGIGPIPFTSVVEYARIYNIEDVEDFLYYIRRLDATYLSFMEKKNNEQNNAN